jgi:hypothetical protein
MQLGIKTHIDLDKVLEDLSTDKVVKVGWVEKQRYPAESGGRYVAEIAAQNEYGAPHLHIPPRPFLAPAVGKNKNKWMGIAKAGLLKATQGDTNIEDVLKIVGEVAAGDVREAIKAVTSPVLSPHTIAKRLAKYSNKAKVGSLTKPLIDSGLMLETVTSALEKE